MQKFVNQNFPGEIVIFSGEILLYSHFPVGNSTMKKSGHFFEEKSYFFFFFFFFLGGGGGGWRIVGAIL